MQRLLTALAGPVVAREAVALARGRRHYLARVLYGLALFAGLCVLWLAVYGTCGAAAPTPPPGGRGWANTCSAWSA